LTVVHTILRMFRSFDQKEKLQIKRQVEIKIAFSLDFVVILPRYGNYKTSKY
jgi:hypothetical protein